MSPKPASPTKKNSKANDPGPADCVVGPRSSLRRAGARLTSFVTLRLASGPGSLALGVLVMGFLKLKNRLSPVFLFEDGGEWLRFARLRQDFGVFFVFLVVETDACEA